MKFGIELAITVSDGAVENVQESLTQEKTVELAHRIPLKIPDATVDMAIDLSVMIGTVTEVYIHSDQFITVKRELDTNTETQCKVMLLSGTKVTKLFISNDSGDEANVIIDVAGGT